MGRGTTEKVSLVLKSGPKDFKRINDQKESKGTYQIELLIYELKANDNYKVEITYSAVVNLVKEISLITLI